VSRNERFQALVDSVTAKAKMGWDNVEALADADLDGKSVRDTITEAVGTIGEHMNLRRFESVKVEQGFVATYVHNAISEGKGKIGVLVGLESSKPRAELEALGKQVAMHVAAANPLFLNVDSVDQDALERERTVLKEQAKEQGKPDDIAEKMVEGRIRKYYEETVLTEQIFVMDGENKISKLLGNDIKLTGFVRMVLGEGVEVEESDFAAEVASMAG
jgi:elongation factor Ts